MSVACIRVAYKLFHRNGRDKEILVSYDHSPLINEENFIAEIVSTEDCAFIFQSLQTLKQVEQIIIKERYYGSFSFNLNSQQSCNYKNRRN